MSKNMITSDEFIMRMILIFFSKYRNMQDEINTKTPANRFYSCEEMMDFVDPQRNKSSEIWRALLQLWDAPEEYLDFFAKFIMDYKKPPKNNEKSALTMQDAENIFYLACVMSYALEKKSTFYEGLRAELQDTIFGMAEM